MDKKNIMMYDFKIGDLVRIKPKDQKSWLNVFRETEQAMITIKIDYGHVFTCFLQLDSRDQRIDISYLEKIE